MVSKRSKYVQSLKESVISNNLLHLHGHVMPTSTPSCVSNIFNRLHRPPLSRNILHIDGLRPVHDQTSIFLRWPLLPRQRNRNPDFSPRRLTRPCALQRRQGLVSRASALTGGGPVFRRTQRDLHGRPWAADFHRRNRRVVHPHALRCQMPAHRLAPPHAPLLQCPVVFVLRRARRASPFPRHVRQSRLGGTSSRRYGRMTSRAGDAFPVCCSPLARGLPHCAVDLLCQRLELRLGGLQRALHLIRPLFQRKACAT